MPGGRRISHGPPWILSFLLGDPEKLDLEDKNLERRNAVGSRLAVGEIVGKRDTPLRSDRHHLQDLDPARNYLVTPKVAGLPRFTELSNTCPLGKVP